MYEHGSYKGSHSDDYQLAGQTESPDALGKFSHYMEKLLPVIRLLKIFLTLSQIESAHPVSLFW